MVRFEPAWAPPQVCPWEAQGAAALTGSLEGVKLQDIEGRQRMEQRQTAGAKKMTKGSPENDKGQPRNLPGKGTHAGTHAHGGERGIW